MRKIIALIPGLFEAGGEAVPPKQGFSFLDWLPLLAIAAGISIAIVAGIAIGVKIAEKKKREKEAKEAGDVEEAGAEEDPEGSKADAEKQ